MPNPRWKPRTAGGRDGARPGRTRRLSPGAWGLGASLAGLAGLGAGIATGSAPLLVLADAAIFGAGLVPAVMDRRRTTAQVREAQAGRPSQLVGRDIVQGALAGQLVCLEVEQPRLH
jgi:hypothetical protein